MSISTCFSVDLSSFFLKPPPKAQAVPAGSAFCFTCPLWIYVRCVSAHRCLSVCVGAFACVQICFLGGVSHLFSFPSLNTFVFPTKTLCVARVIYFMVHLIHMILCQGMLRLNAFFAIYFCFI